jgi:hypothetical protein
MLAFWKSTGLATAALLIIPGAARAGTPETRVGLEYDERAPDCPTRAELRSAIGERLGYDPFVEADRKPELILHVEMRRTGSGTQADIAWRSAAGVPEGERQLVSDDEQCDEVASGVVFAVAVQLEMRAASAPAIPPVPPQLPPPKAVPKKKSPPPTPRRAVLVGLGAFVQHGAQPAKAPGLRTFGALRGSRWSLGLEAFGTLPTEWRTADGSGFSASTLGLGLFPCVRSSPWDVCLLGSVGQLSVRGQGVDRPRTPSSAIIGVGLRLQLTWPELGRLATLLHADAWALLTSRDVLVNYEQVWGTAPVVLQAGLDIAAIFR